MIYVVAKNYIREEKVNDFMTLAKKLVEDTNSKDAGCIRYQLYQDINNPTVFTFIEEWESMELLNRHMEADHFKEIVPQLAAMSEKPEDVNILQQI
ncbi:putative quinol monooxygenase [Sinanaerobacter chloroacetimidivorans]|uniref:Antibiotic biosynthesis monooxygenase n=1 Tax=Sinanaerobacter chloroacetimidivorans TaxID=2818044 RepID=A0A8J7VY48_9FIRM|nr:putative quinol monooxygenase [Sinanaerobacter chloroacetimidivorans]MBR0596841.1 antibiotic biosynthesis monooxygenase [Sinanaerobacter chloroacetimidivorans]